MQPNDLKRTLDGGGLAVGTMLFEFHTPGIPRIADVAGADFVVADMEATGLSLERLAALLASARGTGVEPIVRIPQLGSHLVSRPLDLGARALMAPMVESAEQAATFVRWAKYPPVGRRGTAFGIAHDDYLPGSAADKMREANAEVLLLAQIESPDGVEHVDGIAGTDGIDVLWIGHNDLTASLGIPGQLDHPEFTGAVARVGQACRKHGKVLGGLAASQEVGQDMVRAGYRCLGLSNDIQFFRRGLAEGVDALRATLDEGQTPG